ncbi:hypothetical protein Tco_1142903 [Tanacetum coccineum]
MKEHSINESMTVGRMTEQIQTTEGKIDTGKAVDASTLNLSAGLAPPRQMTSDHNSSELGIHDHNNELSRSKLVPKVVPPADKTATSRQELELLFHHHITMLSSQVVNKSPTHYPCDSARTFRVILFSIHNDEWKSFQCHHQTALRSYALSWKPCQGDSLNLPDHRIHKDGDGDASFQLKSDSLPHAHAQTTKTFYKHQDSRIMKAQELKTKTSAQTLIYKIFLQRYQVYQGRLLASFQDDAKYEHVGQDTRSNYILSTTFKPKEPTFQVALDVLSFTSFYQAFLITASGKKTTKIELIHWNKSNKEMNWTASSEISNYLITHTVLSALRRSGNENMQAWSLETETFYKHQDSRIMKAQELKTKTSAQTLIYKIFLQRYQVYQGRLLASFQDDAKYEHVGQDTRSQGGKDDQDKQGKDLKISDIKTKSKDNDKGSRSKITKHEGTSLQRIQRPRPQDLNDKSNLIDLMKECHNELTSGEIVSLKILSRTRKFVHYIRSRSLN